MNKKEILKTFILSVIVTGIIFSGIGILMPQKEVKSEPKQKIEKVVKAVKEIKEVEIVTQSAKSVAPKEKVEPVVVAPVAPVQVEPVAAPVPVFKYIDCAMPIEKQQWVLEYCGSVGLDFELVMAIIRVESNFTEDAISRTSDYGYMQINHGNHAWLRQQLGVTNFLEMKDNIKAGTYILKILSDKYGSENINSIMMAYNMGEPGARRLWNQGIYSSKYSRLIVETMTQYKNR